MTTSKQIKSNISKEGILSISIDQVQVPEPKEGEVLIKLITLTVPVGIEVTHACVLTKFSSTPSTANLYV
ncbi:MAG: hypothetical protein CMD71_02645 [Gammaproteobacteria bacterium]|nr:hypothetical protein [Gammaproteobacteria bacterium]